jgi:probable HAF family extracellular repeat protein
MRVVVVAAVAAAAVAANGSGWQATPLEAGAQLWGTAGIAVDDRGEILMSGLVGGSNTRGFLWRDGKLTNLGMFTAGESDALVPVAMNDRADVVGYATTTRRTRAFLWEGGRLRDLGVLPGKTDSRAVGINERGQVVGVSFRQSSAGDRAPRAFIWQDGRLTDLGALGGSTSSAAAINESGTVVGWATTATGVRHAFVWKGSHMRDLGVLRGKRWSAAVAVNDRGEIAGDSFDGLGRPPKISGLDSTNGERGSSAFLWKDGRMVALTPKTSSAAVALNGKGEVIGHTLTIRSRVFRTGGPRLRWVETRGFLWRRGRAAPLALPRGDSFSDARAIDDAGTIVGYAGVVGAYQAYAWSGGKRTLLPDPGGAGHDPEVTPTAINGHDQIVGTRTATMDSSHAVLWTHP